MLADWPKFGAHFRAPFLTTLCKGLSQEPGELGMHSRGFLLRRLTLRSLRVRPRTDGFIVEPSATGCRAIQNVSRFLARRKSLDGAGYLALRRRSVSACVSRVTFAESCREFATPCQNRGEGVITRLARIKCVVRSVASIVSGHVVA